MPFGSCLSLRASVEHARALRRAKGRSASGSRACHGSTPGARRRRAARGRRASRVRPPRPRARPPRRAATRSAPRPTRGPVPPALSFAATAARGSSAASACASSAGWMACACAAADRAQRDPAARPRSRRGAPTALYASRKGTPRRTSASARSVACVKPSSSAARAALGVERDVRKRQRDALDAAERERRGLEQRAGGPPAGRGCSRWRGPS